ncbi:hypothetical protein BDV30DRAFT_212817 [Aspergillus minisclerotigenes]|uniref:Uncharacterized protein n=1 Tax=Aspergillus minisclerotigenes TaxID=656917 RepID=A0A5N6J2X3_9EURO|nr:hypothetical protein BDV30DRAFT_212817 [Aspergillus minisclerotigenes]
MPASIWPFLGWRDEPSQSPPPVTVTVTGVRIPADGTPAHLLPLNTISDSTGTDSFLIHVPDLRVHWNVGNSWDFRDLHRLDFQLDSYIERSHHLRLKHDLQQVLLSTRRLKPEQLLHLRQRHLLHQQFHILQQQQSSCAGAYYVFFSFAVDDLPENLSVPAWISHISNGDQRHYRRDVFLVKMAPCEYGEDGCAIYEDIDPLFLDVLAEGPLPGASISKSPFYNTM